SKLEMVQTTLDERIVLGGIDGPDGSARINAIFLKARMGSLETLGATKDAAAIFLRRLAKLFKALPQDAQQRIYLVGYSQGTNVAYEMMVQAAQDSERYPFYKNLKGAITLAGVSFGSEA